jgi:sec-independent protein translocase protein TatA
MALLGTQEILLVFVAIILLFGAAKLPDLARSMGKSLGEFKRGQIEAEKELVHMSSSPSPPFQPPPQNTDVALTRVQRMARTLNIEIIDKSEEELLSEIEKKLAK